MLCIRHIDSIPPEGLLSHRSVTQELFSEAIDRIVMSNDIIVVDNSLQVLSIFLQCIFTKPFVSFSSDVISILAGLDKIDDRFQRLLEGLNSMIQNGATFAVKISAIRTATIAAGGAYQTSLVSYFTYKDMFGSIISFIREPNSDLFMGDAFSLLGILASFDKLEAHNPYQIRLADFVDDLTMSRMVHSTGHVWRICLEQYQNPAIKNSANDSSTSTPVSSSSPPLSPTLSANTTTLAASASATAIGIGATLASWLGLRLSSFSDFNYSEVSSELPHPTLSLVLATYEFINVNKVFSRLFVQGKGQLESSGANRESNALHSTSPPIASFISLSSYLFQNQHKSSRASSYARLCLIILRILVEDSTNTVVKYLVNEKGNEDYSTNQIQICRSRNPQLPLIPRQQKRKLMEGVLDSLQCCIRYNMRRSSMNYEMYSLCLTTIFQIIAYLRTREIRLSYHWGELWKSLLYLVGFMNSHKIENDNNSNSNNNSDNQEIVAGLVILILGAALIHGDAILPDSQQYDDLFYKLIGAANDLEKFKATFSSTSTQPAMSVILAAINHYKALLSEGKGKRAPTAEQVSEIIKQGYQSLSLHPYAANSPRPVSPSSSSSSLSKLLSSNSLLLYDNLPRYKEVDERLFLKKVTRMVISDTRQLYAYAF